MGPPSGPFSYRESEFLYDPRGIGFMELISGNEAIARGAWEAGATIGVAYPGHAFDRNHGNVREAARRICRMVPE